MRDHPFGRSRRAATMSVSSANIKVPSERATAQRRGVPQLRPAASAVSTKSAKSSTRVPATTCPSTRRTWTVSPTPASVCVRCPDVLGIETDRTGGSMRAPVECRAQSRCAPQWLLSAVGHGSVIASTSMTARESVRLQLEADASRRFEGCDYRIENVRSKLGVCYSLNSSVAVHAPSDGRTDVVRPPHRSRSRHSRSRPP